MCKSGTAKSHCDRTQGCRPVNGGDRDRAIGAPGGLELLEGTEGLERQGAIPVDLGHDHVVAHRVLEDGGGTFCQEPAGGDDPHPVGQAVGFLEVLGGQEDRHAELAVEPPDLGPDSRPAVGVESRGGLVEKQHLWVVDQGGSEIQTPLHSTRIRADTPIDGGADVDQVEDLRESHPDLRGAQPVEAPLQGEQFTPGLPVVNGRILERDADPDADRSGILRHVVPGHGGRPGTGFEQRAEDPYDRRLAGAVGTQESVDLPSTNAEIETVDCDRRTETTDEPCGTNSCVDGIVLEGDLRSTLNDILDGIIHTFQYVLYLSVAQPMSLQPLTPERRRQQTREHLLAAAAVVFAERGFHGASLDEVAAVAGFTKGAVYSNFKNKEDLFLALFKANYEQEMQALRATLEGSEVPPEGRISDFVSLIRDETRRARNMGLLYQEFWLYAARNPAAREELTRIDDEGVEALAEIIEAERARQGIEPLESAVQAARLIEILFRGIGQLRVLQPDVADDELVEAAISFVARGLGASID